ncbi:hypothetical protein D3C80_1990890 [compost metagenome]
MPASTTQEIKCGNVRIVWKNRLAVFLENSLSRIAKMIGIGKLISSFITLITIVFLNAV